MVEKLKKWFSASIEKNGFKESVYVLQNHEVKKDFTVDFAIFVHDYLVGYCFKDLELVLPSVKSSLEISNSDFYSFGKYLNSRKDMFTDVPNKLEYGLIFMLFNNKTLIATSTLTVMPYDFRIKNYDSFNKYFNLYIQHKLEIIINLNP
jgi:hypothetical protein